jgi:hypothetical protein
MDGEGSFMLAKVSRRTGLGYQYVPRLSIDNTNNLILKQIQECYGGGLSEQLRREKGWRNVFKLVWTGPNVESVLRAVAPHLHVKRRQAHMLLGFMDHVRKTDHGRNWRERLGSEGTVRYRESVYLRMRELNARGPRPPVVLNGPIT